jgi:hypothetical protein
MVPEEAEKLLALCIRQWTALLASVLESNRSVTLAPDMSINVLR